MNLDFLSKLPRDKIGHFLAGCGISFVFAALTQLLWVGVFLAFMAGLGKEGFDYLSNRLRAKKGLPPNHDVDIADAWATGLGGFVPLILVFFLHGVK